MEIADALRESSEALGWTPARVATVAEVSEQSARSWLAGKATPSGDSLIRLMQNMPGFSKALGFERCAA